MTKKSAGRPPVVPPPPPPPPPAPVVVHEIRVHGVNNSPPAEMLETVPDDIRVAAGDGTGTFWSRLSGRTSDGVATVEAYSWGAQTRLGGTPLAVVGTALVHLGWFLLLPYALVNLAYWSRRIPEQHPGHKTWDGGTGAGVVRLFGLVLTLITTAAFTAVAVEIVAVQCFRQVELTEEVCSGLPAILDGAAGWDDDLRIALLSFVPVVALLVLYLIVRRGRVQFEPGVESFGRSLVRQPAGGAGASGVPAAPVSPDAPDAPDPAAPPEPPVPLLATPGFWAAARVRDTSEVLHLGAATFLVVFLLAFRQLFADGWSVTFAVVAAIGLVYCGTVLVVASSNPQTATRWWLPQFIVGKPDDSAAKRAARKQWFAIGGLTAALALYVGWLVAVALLPETAAGGPDVAVPTVLIGIGVLLALWGLSWNRTDGPRRWWGLGLLSTAGLLFLATQIWKDDAILSASLTLLAFAAIGVHVGVSLRRPAPDSTRRLRAWSGNGAAVAMLFALLAATSLNTLLVLGVSAFLGTLPPAGADGIWRTLQEAAPGLGVPDTYEKSAVVLMMVVAVVAVVLVVTALRLVVVSGVRRFTRPTLRWRDGASGVEEKAADELSGVFAPGKRYPLRYEEKADPGRIELHATTLAKKRRTSQLLHRGEALGMWVALATAVGFVVLISPGAVELTRQLLIGAAGDHLPTSVREVAMALLAVVATAAVARVVVSAVSRSDRPLGIFWDVVGFLPRAGHPFAPPCFSERAVPELAERIRTLVRRKNRGAVLLSAHSMGSTICAATILALRGDDDGRGGRITDHIALLSFGSQLRGYFSRFFPCVLGFQVLGVPGVRAPSLWQLDPWQAQITHEFSEVGCAERRDLAERVGSSDMQVCLRDMLTTPGRTGPRWRNLWRRTDYLGFPVFGYASTHNPIDLGASEVAPGYLWAIADHSPYLGQDQFRRARADLAEQLKTPAR